jgi:hypothetical protein
MTDPEVDALDAQALTWARHHADLRAEEPTPESLEGSGIPGRHELVHRLWEGRVTHEALGNEGSVDILRGLLGTRHKGHPFAHDV